MTTAQATGASILRVALGIIFLAHSAYLKVFVFTMAGTAGYFESIGLPAFSAYAVCGIEMVGGLALITGIRVREAAIALAIVAFGAVWAHSSAGWLFTNEGGGWEYPLFLGLAAVAQALLGPGRFALTLPAARRQAARAHA
ncbi:MAG: DoxX family protein [Pseudomonadota bacterium]